MPIYDLREAAITFLTACSPALQLGPHEARRGWWPDGGHADSDPTQIDRGEDQADDLIVLSESAAP
jgi:hypothetical protein